MRATARGGKSKRVVDIPTWVEVCVAPSLDDPPAAKCKRCKRLCHLFGSKADAEAALGRFATWHRRCPDPLLIAEAVVQAPIDRQRAADRDAWFAAQRSQGRTWQPRRK